MLRHVVAGFLAFFVSFTVPAAHAGVDASAPSGPHQYLMTRHVRDEVRVAQAFGRPSPSQRLQFDFVLPVRSPAALEQFLASVYDPKSPEYRHFLTPAEFTNRFGPSVADWNELVAYARRSGFTIIGGSRDEMDLRLSAPVSVIEAALHVTMRTYQHPTEPRTFYSPDTEPTIDLQAEVWHVSGLDNFSLPRPKVKPRQAMSVKAETITGACPGNSYCGSDMRGAYYGSGPLTGTGQSVGLVEFYGYDSADLATYFANAGQVNGVPVNGISTDGTSIKCLFASGCDDTEQTLDMTQALGMAPGLAQLNVYVGSSDTAILSAMSVVPPRSVTGVVDAQLSCSWGWSPADPATDDPYFQKFAAQGQSFFTAAGDSAAYTPTSSSVFPADDGNVTVVGGTALATAGPAGGWQGESAWVDGGGGYFAPDNILMPSWQSAAVAQFNALSGRSASTVLRNSPDVSAEANFDFYVCANQTRCTSNLYGGTSFAAPMWAGYMALVNQQALQNGQHTVGFLNPALYAIGASASQYPKAFHDVTSGSNGFPAIAGYDLASGWGSPNGGGLIALLASPSAPTFTLSAAGGVAAYTGSTAAVALTAKPSGGFSGTIALGAAGLPAGVTVSFSATTISATGSATATFHVAPTVAAGSYPVVFSGTSGSLVNSVPVSLNVTASGFTLGAASSLTVYQGRSAAMTISSKVAGVLPGAIALTATGLPAGVTVAFSPASMAATGGSASATFSVSAGAPAGTYAVTMAGASGNLTQSVPVSLTVAAPTFALSSPASLSVAQGGSGAVVVSSSSGNGFAAGIALSAAGQPAGVTVAFAPASITGVGSATLSFQVAAGVAAGTYPVTISGSGAGVTATTTVTLNVTATGFTLAALAPSITIEQGAGGTATLTTTATGALAAPVALTLAVPGGGFTATLSAKSVSPPGSVGLALQVPAGAPVGSYPLTVTGTSGNLTQQVTLTLIVTAPSPPAFSFAPSTASLTLTHGTSASFTVRTAVAGASGPAIALSLAGLPSGVTAVFSPASLSGAGLSTVTLTAGATARTATPATLVLTASGGGSTQSSSVSLTVN